MTFVVATPILPTSITSSSMNAYFLNGLLEARKKVLADMYRTTRTWKTKHPKFKTMIRYRGGDALIVGTTDGETLDNDVWEYLDKGTQTRHAVMTKDFIPKTRRRKVTPTIGAGGLAFVSWNMWRPGIEAREFSEQISEENEEYLHRTMIKAIDNALTKGHFGVFK